MTTRRTAFPYDCPHPDCGERFSEPGLVAEHVELFHDEGKVELGGDDEGGAEDVEEPAPAP